MRDRASLRDFGGSARVERMLLRRARMKQVLLLALGLAALVGCSSNNTANNGANDAGADHQTEPPVDSSTPDAAQPDAAPPLPYAGKVLLEEIGSTTYGVVDIKTRELFVSTFNCPSNAVVSGRCCFIPPADDDAGTLAMVSAGTIALADKGTSIGAVPFQGTTYPTSVGTSSWGAGDTLSVTAPGDVVKAFTGSVVAPEVLVATAPTAASQSITKDMAITWTPSATPGATIIAYMGAAVDDTHRGTLKCLADDATGALTVPASILGHFRSGGTGALALARGNASFVASENANIEIIAFHGTSINVTLAP
jgi:hypothetical protein